jgi:hypothetical protein
MAYVPVPRDLTKIKTKVLFNLTGRQLICFGAAAAVGIPVFFLTKDAIGNSSAVLLMIGLMLPAFFIAMYEKNGRPAEKILLDFLRARYFFPPKRPYRTENLYQYIVKEALFDPNQKTGKAETTPVAKYPASKGKQKRP